MKGTALLILVTVIYVGEYSEYRKMIYLDVYIDLNILYLHILTDMLQICTDILQISVMYLYILTGISTYFNRYIQIFYRYL
jgi:hypothetical protein